MKLPKQTYKPFTLAVLLCCTCMAVAQSNPVLSNITEVRVYGNSAQFTLSTMTQLQAGTAIITNRTRIKIRFRVYNTTTSQAYTQWQLLVHSPNAKLTLDGGGGGTGIPIGNLQLQAVAGPSIATNTSLNPETVAISATPTQLASGTVTFDPITQYDTVAEAEMLVTYTLTGPFTGYDEGTYWANLVFVLEEI